MARRRTSTPNTAAATAPRRASPNDRTLYTHNLWLNYLKPVSLGLVFSPNALRAAQIELPLQSAEAQRALEALTISRPVADDDETDHENPPRTLRGTREFLTEFLGWKPELLDFFRPSAEPRCSPAKRLAQTPTADEDRPHRPTSCGMTWLNTTTRSSPASPTDGRKPPETGSRWCLLGLDVPPDVDLDRKPPDADETTWVESPQKKFERLLYETGIPLGLIVQGTAVRLVYRPEEQQSGYITLPARSAAETGRPSGVLRAQGHPQSRPDASASRPAAAAPHPGREPQVSERGLDPARRAGAGRPVRAAERVRGGRRGIARPASSGACATGPTGRTRSTKGCSPC